MNASIQRHCAELDRCNQRGGRMLSVFDLLEAGTLSTELAAYLMARIGSGASFLTGARPGGAGKTTVMCALLNFVPANVELAPATGPAVRCASAGEKTAARQCYICHEIGAGPYFAYLWGGELRAYCALAERGCMLATNLHSDTAEEARAQICDENGVPERHFRAFGLLIFLRVKRGHFGSRHWIETVYSTDGASPHRLVFDANSGAEPDFGDVDASWLDACHSFVRDTAAAGERTIEDTRARVLDFFATHPKPE